MAAPDQESTPRTTAQSLSLSELGSSGSANAPLVMASENPLHQVRTKLTVCVGTAEVTVGDLLKAREHQVIRLDRTIDQPIDILLEGQVIARGTLVAVDDHFGVRITELPRPLKP